MLGVLNEIISGFVFSVADLAGNFWKNLSLVQVSVWQVVIDILLVAILFYLFVRIVQGSRAVNILLGMVMLGLVFYISRALQLLAMSWLLDRLVTMALIAIPIIFQQELRRGLEKLGRTKFFLAQEAKEIDFLTSEIVEASFAMAKENIGGLIVFRKDVSLKEYVDTGVPLYAKISKELLLSIFMPGTPLHDGAAILENGKIVAAGCILPHSFKKMTHTYGTRHKAAIALSESTDAHVIVISEQKGIVSFVKDGNLSENISQEKLAEFLAVTFGKQKKGR